MLDRSAFLYLEPTLKGEDFQCSSCKMFIADKGICSLHGPNVRIKPTMSCGLYCKGGPADESELEHVSAAFTPKESGLIDAKVTCSNCEFYDSDDSECMVFCVLGLEDKVLPTACCNAFKPEEKKESKKSTLKKFVR